MEEATNAASTMAKNFLGLLMDFRKIKRVTKAEAERGEGDSILCKDTGEPFFTLSSKRYRSTEREFISKKPYEVFKGLAQEVISQLPSDGTTIYLLNSPYVWINKVANQVEMQLWGSFSWAGCKESLRPEAVKLPV